MSNYLLDKAYRLSSETGVAANRVVVRGATPDECAIPTGANAGDVLGITTHAQPRNGRHVAIRRLGIASAVAAGAITAGSRVRVADNTGRIAALPAPRYTTGSGTTELLVDWLAFSLYTPAITVALYTPGTTAAFGWTFTGGALRLTLATNSGGTVTETVASLILAVAADATLSRLIRVTKGGGASDSATLAATTAVAGNLSSLLNAIGIAEQTAAQEGDIIDVLLNP